MEKKDIFSRIREHVNGSPTANDLRETIRVVGVSVDDEREFRSQFEQTASNPLVDTAEAERAQGEIAKSHLKEQRLEAALKLLQTKLGETAHAEHQAALVEAYDAAQTERDRLVADFRRDWAKHAPRLVALLKKTQELDVRLRDVRAPDGRPDLESAEDLLNDTPTRRSDSAPYSVARPSLFDQFRLPAIAGLDTPAWDAVAEREEREQAARARIAMENDKRERQQSLMARFGTTDELVVARKLKEEREARARVDEAVQVGGRFA